MAKKELSKKEEEALLEEIRERWTYCENEWSAIREEARKDMRYVAGDPWEPKDRQAREDMGRPCLSLDELGQYYNQIINDVRANPRALKFTPTGDGANDQGAELYQNKAREIEYRSKAQIPYTTAFENAVQRSYGFCRVNTRYSTAKGSRFAQDIWIEAFPNPDMVYPDPDALSPDSSDMQYCFVREPWDIKEFKRTYPKAKVQDFSELIADHASWVGAEKIWLAEYWKIKTVERELLQIKTVEGQIVEAFEDDPERPQGTVTAQRTVDDPRVCHYLTNGVEILKTTEWPGKYIPIASCYGKILYVDDGSGTKRQLVSMTRLARDPYMLYCYYRTQQAEMAAMIPKAPVIGYKGQFSGMEKDWQRAPHEPLAYLEANATTDATSSQILPLPQRLAYEAGAHLQALELCAEGARRAIQAAMGMSPLPTSAQRRNEKSGVALKQIEETSQRGTFHFIDHYNDMISHVGVIIEDLFDHVYDTARSIGVRKANDDAKMQRINDPNDPQSISTQGDYIATISTGPKHDSEREAQDEFVDMLSSNTLEIIANIAGPKTAAAVLSKAIKMKPMGALGDEIADLILPAEFKEEGGVSPEVLQERQQAQQMVEQLMQRVKELEQELATDAIKAERDVALAQLKGELQIALQKLKGAQDMRLQDDEQAHELGIEGAKASHAEQQADKAAEQQRKMGVQSAALGGGASKA